MPLGPRGLPCRLPVVGAAMAGVAGGRLAAEVALAGGFGFIASVPWSIERFTEEISVARKLLNVEHGRMSNVGAGYLAWSLEQKPEEEAFDYLRLGIASTSAIWLSFGRRLEFWIDMVREMGGRAIPIFVVVSTLEEALRMAQKGVDVLIVQGNEAGGHGLAAGQPLFSLFPLVAKHLQRGDLPPTLLVGAGGIVHPAQVAALLSLPSCGGAVLGTALLATPASLYTEKQKDAIVAAQHTGARTTLFDKLRGSLSWPDGVDARGLDNASSRMAAEGVDIDVIKKEYESAALRGDSSHAITWAGTSVGLVIDKSSVAQILEGIEPSITDASTKLQTTGQDIKEFTDSSRKAN